MINKLALFFLDMFFNRNSLTRDEDQAIIQAMDIVRSKIYSDFKVSNKKA